MTQLAEAYTQWNERPNEECYENVTQMKEEAYVDMCYAKEREYDKGARIDVSHQDGLLKVHTPDAEFFLNNWTMGQVCSMAKAPKKYISTLSAPLAVSCLQESMTTNRNQMATGFMFMSKNDGETDELRCITSPRYVRIYDYDILSYIEGMQVTGWKPPPKNTVAPGGKRAANRTGLYRSDRNMFAFMVNEENRINDGTDEGLARGFFVGNSEVGGGSFFIKTFLYRYICGNHLVMGCREIQEVSLKHIGKGLKGTAMGALARDLTLYANSSVLEVETRIADAKLKTLGKDSEEVVDFMFKRLNLTKSNAIKAWDKCIEEEPELDPTSVWGMVQGITAVAREEEFTDSRVNMEKSATKLMELV